jgi:hypothetical protein
MSEHEFADTVLELLQSINIRLRRIEKRLVREIDDLKRRVEKLEAKI